MVVGRSHNCLFCGRFRKSLPGTHLNSEGLDRKNQVGLMESHPSLTTGHTEKLHSVRVAIPHWNVSQMRDYFTLTKGPMLYARHHKSV